MEHWNTKLWVCQPQDYKVSAVQSARTSSPACFARLKIRRSTTNLAASATHALCHVIINCGANIECENVLKKNKNPTDWLLRLERAGREQYVDCTVSGTPCWISVMHGMESFTYYYEHLKWKSFLFNFDWQWKQIYLVITVTKHNSLKLSFSKRISNWFPTEFSNCWRISTDELGSHRCALTCTCAGFVTKFKQASCWRN